MRISKEFIDSTMGASIFDIIGNDKKLADKELIERIVSNKELLTLREGIIHELQSRYIENAALQSKTLGKMIDEVSVFLSFEELVFFGEAIRNIVDPYKEWDQVKEDELSVRGREIKNIALVMTRTASLIVREITEELSMLNTLQLLGELPYANKLGIKTGNKYDLDIEIARLRRNLKIWENWYANPHTFGFISELYDAKMLESI